MSCRADALGQKLSALERWFKGKEGAIIAFSGGMDSTLVASVARMALGDRALAMTAVTEFTGEGDIEGAIAAANKIGISHRLIRVSLPHEVLNNPKNRCYLCKKAIMAALRKVADSEGIRVIADGTNFDDIGSGRPGILALKEAGIESPLAELRISKEEVMDLSLMIGLDANKTPNSCLATRFPFGHRITREEMEMVEKAERFLRANGFSVVRVRVSDLAARIEVLQPEIQRAIDLRRQIVTELKKIGFRRVGIDLEGYQPGSMDYFEGAAGT